MSFPALTQPAAEDTANCPTSYGISFSREFRDGSARAWYLVRTLDVSAGTGLMHTPDPLFASTANA